MKKEITEYYCDICGKKMDRPDFLKEIKIPIKHIKYYVTTLKETKDIKSLEICPECMNALYEAIQEHVADICTEVWYDCSYATKTQSVKYKENKDV